MSSDAYRVSLSGPAGAGSQALQARRDGWNLLHPELQEQILGLASKTASFDVRSSRMCLLDGFYMSRVVYVTTYSFTRVFPSLQKSYLECTVTSSVAPELTTGEAWRRSTGEEQGRVNLQRKRFDVSRVLAVRLCSRCNRAGVHRGTVLELDCEDARGRRRTERTPWWSRTDLEDPVALEQLRATLRLVDAELGASSRWVPAAPSRVSPARPAETVSTQLQAQTGLWNSLDGDVQAHILALASKTASFDVRSSDVCLLNDSLLRRAIYITTYSFKRVLISLEGSYLECTITSSIAPEFTTTEDWQRGTIAEHQEIMKRRPRFHVSRVSAVRIRICAGPIYRGKPMLQLNYKDARGRWCTHNAPPWTMRDLGDSEVVGQLRATLRLVDAELGES